MAYDRTGTGAVYKRLDADVLREAQMAGMVCGYGISQHESGAAAGQEATQQAVAALGALPARLLLVFATDHYRFPDLLAAVGAAGSGASVAGCTTAGILSTAGVDTRGVAVMAIGGTALDVGITAGRGVAAQGDVIAAHMAEALDESLPSDTQTAAVLAFVASDNALDRFTRALTKEPGPLHQVVGGGAGDNLAFNQPQVFHDLCTDYDAAVAIGLRSPFGFGMSVQHGCVQTGRRATVTEGLSNRCVTGIAAVSATGTDRRTEWRAGSGSASSSWASTRCA